MGGKTHITSPGRSALQSRVEKKKELWHAGAFYRSKKGETRRG